MKAPKLDEAEAAYLKLIKEHQDWYLHYMLGSYQGLCRIEGRHLHPKAVYVYLAEQTQIELVRRALVRE